MTALLLGLFAGAANAQQTTGPQAAPPSTAREATARRHEGLYLSLGFGPSFGHVTQHREEGEDRSFFGPGAMIDAKIGGAIAPGLILTFDAIANNNVYTYVKPEDGPGGPGGLLALDVTAGAGLTYYLPGNYFVSGTLGAMQILLSDQGALWHGVWCDPNGYGGCSSVGGTTGGYEEHSLFNVSAHLKAGREWWVSDGWALGVSVGGAFGMGPDASTGEYGEGLFTLYKGFVLFNASFD